MGRGPSKRYREAAGKVDRSKTYALSEAIEILREWEGVKFDESVDLAINLGVDPKHADQMVRGALVLPHGVGKDTRVLVFAKGEKEKEAQEAGADYVALGPIATTDDAPGVTPLGLDGLSAVVQGVEIPVIAAGGIGALPIGEVLQTGAYGIATTRAVVLAPDPEKAAAKLMAEIEGGRQRGAAR